MIFFFKYTLTKFHFLPFFSILGFIVSLAKRACLLFTSEITMLLVGRKEQYFLCVHGTYSYIVVSKSPMIIFLAPTPQPRPANRGRTRTGWLRPRLDTGRHQTRRARIPHPRPGYPFPVCPDRTGHCAALLTVKPRAVRAGRSLPSIPRWTCPANRSKGPRTPSPGNCPHHDDRQWTERRRALSDRLFQKEP